MSEPTITFGSESIFGTQTGWNAGPSSEKTTKQRARSLGATGNETVGVLYDEKTDASQSFEAAAESAPTVADTIGKLVGSYILTGIQLSTSATAMAKMDLAGHNHAVNAHADTLQQAAHGITLSSGFGAQDFLGGTAGDNAEIESGSVSIVCQHTDKNGGSSGDHVIGQNYDCMITATTTWIGEPSVPAAAGWDVTESDETKGNTDHERHTYIGTKTVALADPA